MKNWKIKLNNLGGAIDIFLKENLKLELHKDKSKIINLSRGVDFIGFRNFYHYKLLRKRNIRDMQRKIDLYKNGEICGKFRGLVGLCKMGK